MGARGDVDPVILFVRAERVRAREVVQGRDGEDNNQIRARMGNKSIINFSLTRDLGLTTEFYDWFKTGVDGAVSRRPCTITSFTDTHEAASQIHLFECWVKSYEIGGLDGTGNGHAWEKIECVAEDINYA
jgi:phage tail-like protein